MIQSENELIDFMKPSSEAERESPIFIKRTKITKKSEKETPTNLFIGKGTTDEKSNDFNNNECIENTHEKTKIGNRLNHSRESSFTMFYRNIESKIDHCSQKKFWDSKYDGDFIKFLDFEGKIIYEKQASVYLGKESDLININMNHNIEICKDLENKNYAIVNPKEKNWKLETKKQRVFDWYLLYSLTKELNFQINTDWEPIYILDPSECEKYQRKEKTIFICKNKEFDNFDKYHSYIIVPILDLLLHLFQGYFSFSLTQIAIKINNGFDEKFFDEKETMKFVFKFHEEEIKDICQKEVTSIHKIIDSDFNLTFCHTKNGFTKKEEIFIINNLTDVISRPLSFEYDTKNRSYGNIPYHIKHYTNVKKDQKNKRICENGPIGYTPRNQILDFDYDCPQSEHFIYITIFPKMTFDNAQYPTFYIGIVQKGNTLNSREFVLRGKIFENVTLREYLIINEMYYSFCMKKLERNTDFSNCHKSLPLSNKDSFVRTKLINFIKGELISVLKTD